MTEVAQVVPRSPNGVVTSDVDIPAAPVAQTGPVVAAPTDRVIAGPAPGPAPGQGYDVDATTRRIDELRARGATVDDPTTAPSFWQTALEIFDFVLRCIPGIGQIVNLFSAIVNIGVLAYKLLSGQDSERIDWTKELARIAGDLMGVAFPIAGALSNAILNYWFDTASDRRQGARVFGFEPLLGPNMQSSTGYYSRKLFEGVRGMISGPTPPAAYAGQPTYPAGQAAPQVLPDGLPPGTQMQTLPDGRHVLALPDGRVIEAPQQVDDPALRAGPPQQGGRELRRFTPRVE